MKSAHPSNVKKKIDQSQQSKKSGPMTAMSKLGQCLENRPITEIQNITQKQNKTKQIISISEQYKIDAHDSN